MAPVTCVQLTCRVWSLAVMFTPKTCPGEATPLSLSLMVPVKFMVTGVASPLPPLGSFSQCMVIVSLLSAAASSVMGDVEACLGVPCGHGYTGFASREEVFVVRALRCCSANV